MKKVYPKLLKKLSVKEIQLMRVLAMLGKDQHYLAKLFNVATTTVSWHCGDVLKDEYEELH